MDFGLIKKESSRRINEFRCTVRRMQMEAHIIEIIRFIVYIVTILMAVALMIKADDNNAMRRLSVAFAVLLVCFNEQIGVMLYLLIGAILETVMAVMGMVFLVILAVTVMILPLIALFRWIFH